MSTAWLFAVCLIAAPADAKVTAESHAARTTGVSQAATRSEPKDLPEAVYDALRRFRRSSVPEREQLVPELVALYEQVPRTSGLERKQQVRLLRVLERRLRQAERTLKRRVAREERAAKGDASQEPSQPSPASVQPASGRFSVLAQQIGAQGQAGGGAGGLGGPLTNQTVANAQQLIDLIRNTICPDTWAARGGNGRIVYYSPLQVLVVTH